VVIIEDEGPGFAPTDVPDPTAEENLEKPGGRGIMLMKAFMTRVEYNQKGNRVRLEKVRDGSAE
jgi:serine/threonine-protein kinase RsbW